MATRFRARDGLVLKAFLEHESCVELAILLNCIDKDGTNLSSTGFQKTNIPGMYAAGYLLAVGEECVTPIEAQRAPRRKKTD